MRKFEIKTTYQTTIWDYELCDILKDVIKTRTGVKVTPHATWDTDSGSFDGFYLGDFDAHDFSEEAEELLEKEFGVSLISEPWEVKDIVFEYLFGTTSIEVLSGSGTSGRGDTELTLIIPEESALKLKSAQK